MVVVFEKELIPEELRRFVSPACNMENGRNFLRDIDFKGWDPLEVFGLLHCTISSLPRFWLRNTVLLTSYW